MAKYLSMYVYVRVYAYEYGIRVYPATESVIVDFRSAHF